MVEYIKRGQLILEIDKEFDKTDPVGEEQIGFLKCRRIAREIPAEGVAPVRHGRWLHHTMIDGHVHAECSECHKVRIIDNYCPNCGAKMDGGEPDA